MLEPTDENGSEHGQWMKVQHGAIEALTSFPQRMRIRSQPMLCAKKRTLLRKGLLKMNAANMTTVKKGRPKGTGVKRAQSAKATPAWMKKRKSFPPAMAAHRRPKGMPPGGFPNEIMGSPMFDQMQGHHPFNGFPPHWHGVKNEVEEVAPMPGTEPEWFSNPAAMQPNSATMPINQGMVKCEPGSVMNHTFPQSSQPFSSPVDNIPSLPSSVSAASLNEISSVTSPVVAEPSFNAMSPGSAILGGVTSPATSANNHDQKQLLQAEVEANLAAIRHRHRSEIESTVTQGAYPNQAGQPQPYPPQAIMNGPQRGVNPSFMASSHPDPCTPPVMNSHVQFPRHMIGHRPTPGFTHAGGPSFQRIPRYNSSMYPNNMAYQQQGYPQYPPQMGMQYPQQRYPQGNPMSNGMTPHADWVPKQTLPSFQSLSKTRAPIPTSDTDWLGATANSTPAFEGVAQLDGTSDPRPTGDPNSQFQGPMGQMTGPYPNSMVNNQGFRAGSMYNQQYQQQQQQQQQQQFPGQPYPQQPNWGSYNQQSNRQYTPPSNGNLPATSSSGQFESPLYMLSNMTTNHPLTQVFSDHEQLSDKQWTPENGQEPRKCTPYAARSMSPGYNMQAGMPGMSGCIPPVGGMQPGMGGMPNRQLMVNPRMTNMSYVQRMRGQINNFASQMNQQQPQPNADPTRHPFMNSNMQQFPNSFVRNQYLNSMHQKQMMAEGGNFHQQPQVQPQQTAFFPREQSPSIRTSLSMMSPRFNGQSPSFPSTSPGFPSGTSPHLSRNSPHLPAKSPHLPTNTTQLPSNSPLIASSSPHLTGASPHHLSQSSPHLSGSSPHLAASSPHMTCTPPQLSGSSGQIAGGGRRINKHLYYGIVICL